MSGLKQFEESDRVEIIEAGALESMTRAEAQMQVATAKRYPRSVQKFIDEATTMACLDAETAASMYYAKPQDKTIIEGPSIRLAEIAAAAWGNISASRMIISTTHESVTALGYVWDMQTNSRSHLQITRSILKRNGQRFSDSMIATTQNAAMAIAYRNAIFSVIPRAYVEPIWHKAKKVAMGDEKTMVSRRDGAMSFFSKRGVAADRILNFSGKPSVDDMTLDDIGTLIGVVNAVKTGDTTIDDLMPVQPIDQADGVKKFGFQKTKAIAEKTDDQKQELDPPVEKI